jgi:CRP-like cAMP-binding protein
MGYGSSGKDGIRIFAQGDAADTIFYIQEGKVRLTAGASPQR